MDWTQIGYFVASILVIDDTKDCFPLAKGDKWCSQKREKIKDAVPKNKSLKATNENVPSNCLITTITDSMQWCSLIARSKFPQKLENFK